jgi:hypothetical protein
LVVVAGAGFMVPVIGLVEPVWVMVPLDIVVVAIVVDMVVVVILVPVMVGEDIVLPPMANAWVAMARAAIMVSAVTFFMIYYLRGVLCN